MRRYLVNMEVRIDAFDTRNRQHLDELHQEIEQLYKRYFNTRHCLSDKEESLMYQ